MQGKKAGQNNIHKQVSDYSTIKILQSLERCDGT